VHPIGFQNYISSKHQLSGRDVAIIRYFLPHRTMVPLYLDAIPAGTSTRPIVHYAQLHLLNDPNEFRKFDFGNEQENIQHYGTPDPPLHDLNNVQVPTALWAGDNDSLADIKDVERLRDTLSNVSHYEVVDLKGFSHFDFAIGIDADKLVYAKILEMMNASRP
jgi:pimeloyl-ACP methyl ester carboxylesterase